MGKRSDFKRIDKDFYITPYKAVEPLIPFLALDNIKTFYEPCGGNGALVRHLESYGLSCVGCSDIDPQSKGILQKDAFDLSESDLKDADAIITNPPWSRNILHPMIKKFSSLKPTYFLFDSDWAHTKQSEIYIKKCKKIISVGRCKWIKDSPFTGKDNVSWYLFDSENVNFSEFYGRKS